MTSVKQLERAHLDAFLFCRPDLGLPSPIHADAPDFRFGFLDKRLGVEHTRFVPDPGSSPFIATEQGSLRDQVMQRARGLYEDAGGPALQVSADFNNHILLRRPRVDSLADEVATYLLAKANGVPLYAEAPLRPYEEDPRLREIGHLSARRFPDPSFGVWYAAQGGWVRQADETDFRRVLRIKEPLLDSYRRECDEVWLLVVFEPLAGSDHVEGPSVPVPFQLTTRFDRVFSLDRIGNRCIEIPCNSEWD